jgi:LmbE family N-acetylglucosaminyl deacetylase
MVVAHPDDETIFYGGLLQAHRRYPWHVICVTDGNADGGGAQRKQDFLAACKLLKVAKAEMWDFQDIFAVRLDLERLQKKLGELPGPHSVYTHSTLGEYGHPHHQDVAMAVHQHFKHPVQVWSVAYNSFPQKMFRLNKKAYQLKQKILSQTYLSQTVNFSRFLPCSAVEGIHQLERKEVQAIYDFMLGQPLRTADLKVYKAYTPYLEKFR